MHLWKQVGAPARVGLVAPIDVIVPPGNTGLDPSQTSFFQVCYKTNTSIFKQFDLLKHLNPKVELISGAEHPNKD